MEVNTGAIPGYTKRELVAEDVDVVTAISEAPPQLGRDDTAAPVRGMTDDTDVQWSFHGSVSKRASGSATGSGVSLVYASPKGTPISEP